MAAGAAGGTRQIRSECAVRATLAGLIERRERDGRLSLRSSSAPSRAIRQSPPSALALLRREPGRCQGATPPAGTRLRWPPAVGLDETSSDSEQQGTTVVQAAGILGPDPLAMAWYRRCHGPGPTDTPSDQASTVSPGDRFTSGVPWVCLRHSGKSRSAPGRQHFRRLFLNSPLPAAGTFAMIHCR